MSYLYIIQASWNLEKFARFSVFIPTASPAPETALNNLFSASLALFFRPDVIELMPLVSKPLIVINKSIKKLNILYAPI